MILVQAVFRLDELAPTLYPVREHARKVAKGRQKCWPKEQHRSEGAARAQLRSIVKRGLEKNAARIHVYQCPCCRCWHVGHGS